jgi:hypothetical protein
MREVNKMRVTILVGLLLAGCLYDYASLEKRAEDAGAPGSGTGTGGGQGASSGTTGPSSGGSGSGGSLLVVSTGGSTAATGGAQTGGTQTGGAPSGAAGERGSGGAGAHVTGRTTGAGGSAAGGDTRGGAGNPGATGGGAAGAGGAGGATKPTIFSIDFVGGLPATGGTAGITAAPSLRPTDVAGARPAAHWNSAFGAAGVLASLTLSDGTSSSAKVTWSSPPTGATAPGVWRLQLTDASPDAVMMDGYLDPSSTTLPATILVANLPDSIASRGYDVYVYCLGAITSAAETRTYAYAIGATILSVSQSGVKAPPTSFGGFQVVAQNSGTGNYVVFHNVTGTAFSLVATPVTGDFKRAPVNGIQIVSPP